MNTEQFFTVTWPDLAPRLRAMLARAGAPESERDDVLQETAVRLLGMWERIDPDRPVEALAYRIAMNVWRDQWRHRGAREVIGAVPDLPAVGDTERTALARVEVRDVSQAIASLPAKTAQVLRMAATEAESGEPRVATSASVRMARTRARRALMACVQVASGVVAAALAGGRWLGRHGMRATTTAAMATAAFVLAVTMPAISAPEEPKDSGGVVETTNATRVSAPSAGTARASHALTGPRTAAAHLRHRSKASEEPAYYTVDAGVTQLSTFANVEVAGYGVQVSQADSGAKEPVCVSGKTPATPLTPSCSTR